MTLAELLLVTFLVALATDLATGLGVVPFFFFPHVSERHEGVLTAAAAANGLAICPEDSDGLAPGDMATVQMLDWPDQML